MKPLTRAGSVRRQDDRLAWRDWRAHRNPIAKRLDLRPADRVPRRRHGPGCFIGQLHHQKKAALLRMPGHDPIPRTDQPREFARITIYFLPFSSSRFSSRNKPSRMVRGCGG
jgi:hypothetical protein